MGKINLALAVALGLLVVGCGKRDGSQDVDKLLSDHYYGPDVGKVCGSSKILGKEEKSFSNGACGIDNPVRIYEVAGIRLKNPAQVNCQTARALNEWVQTSAKPTARKINKELTGMKIAASYACRNRNHKKGGKLSEHAKGNAVDISEFYFSDGSELSVLKNYSGFSKYFGTIRKQACGTFGTVLGPGVRLHDDHFHFDVASYPGGAYCK